VFVASDKAPTAMSSTFFGALVACCGTLGKATLARLPAPQIPRKSGSRRRSPHETHGRNGAPRHDPARLLKSRCQP